MKLNLGCGKDIKPGWVNLDSVKLPGVDVVWDIQKLPLPFPNGQFEEILANDILEHMPDYIPLLSDLHRLLAPNGKIMIRVPHFTSRNNFVDPTHRRLFSAHTFDFFVRQSPFSKSKEREYYFDFQFSKIASRQITFERSSWLFFYNRFIASLINRSWKSQFYFEATALSRIFPAQNIEIELIK